MNASNPAIVTAMRGVRRSGPCIMGGVSPSLHHARQSVTGPIFTGPALPPDVLLQYGFRESNRTSGGGPASSGSSQSQELTKASRRTPLISNQVDELPSSRGALAPRRSRGVCTAAALWALDCFGAAPLAMTLRNYSARFRITPNVKSLDRFPCRPLSPRKAHRAYPGFSRVLRRCRIALWASGMTRCGGSPERSALLTAGISPVLWPGKVGHPSAAGVR
jgi:hypothetical protein